MKEERKRCSSVGGQAVLEGVMMKNPESGMALAVRRPDGTIVEEFYRKKKEYKKGSFPTWPIVRGVYAFVESLVSGMKITTRSGELLGEEFEEEPTKFEKWLSEKLGKSATDIAMVIAVILAVGLSLGLFVFLPSFLVSLLKLDNSFVISLLEGVLRLCIFLGYVAAISLMKDIKRVFMYHGAEHKTIACYEAEGEMTPENIMNYTRFHARCGTNYLLLVMVVSILFFACIPVKSFWPRLVTRLLFLPVVAGLGYEVLKAAAKSDGPIARAVRAPGLALQRLTTAEPTVDMIEVALVSFNLAMASPAEDIKERVHGAPEETGEAPAEKTEATAAPEQPAAPEETAQNAQ